MTNVAPIEETSRGRRRGLYWLFAALVLALALVLILTHHAPANDNPQVTQLSQGPHSATFRFRDHTKATYAYSLDRAPVIGALTPLTLRGLSTGNHTLTVYAFANGHTYQTTYTWTQGPTPTTSSTTTPTTTSTIPPTTTATSSTTTPAPPTTTTLPKHHRPPPTTTSTIPPTTTTTHPTTTTSTPPTTTTTIAHVALTISGNAPAPLYPGVTEALNLEVTNPSSFAVTVTEITLTFSVSPTTCAASNYAATNLTTSFVVPAHTTESLSEAGLPSGEWPSITMRDTEVDQDVCQGATISLAYTAVAS